MAEDKDFIGKLTSTNICSVCDKVFFNKNTLNRHSRDVHKLNGNDEGIHIQRLKCPVDGCECTITSKFHLNRHLQEVHRIEVHHEEYQFNSFGGEFIHLY